VEKYTIFSRALVHKKANKCINKQRKKDNVELRKRRWM